MNKLTQDALDTIINRTVSKKNIHGVVFHIVSQDNSLNYISAAGNLSENSNYYIASINKMMLSAITLRCCEEGIMDLTHKISDYFPEEIIGGLIVINNIDYSREINIGHLISHTSGLPCYLIDNRPDGKKNMDLLLKGKDQAWPFDKMIREVKKMKSKFPPGTKGKANFSETNFRLLAHILEKVTNNTIKQLLSSLFEELQMKHTHILPEIPVKYTATYFKQEKLSLKNYWKSTNQDIVSTTSDQIIFIKAFFEGHFFPKEKIAELQKWNKIFFPFEYGLGIQKFTMPRILSPFKLIPLTIGHCGSVGSIAFYVPEKEVCICGTVNQASSSNTIFKILIDTINRI